MLAALGPFQLHSLVVSPPDNIGHSVFFFGLYEKMMRRCRSVSQREFTTIERVAQGW